MTSINTYDGIVTRLTDGQNHRVWSLLISIFGDLAQDQGQWLSGTVINRITAEIGIKPEATRVALHRLCKDGWIISRKDGRRSDYSLTDSGRLQSSQASPRIYDDPFSNSKFWLVIHDPDRPSTQASDAPPHWISPQISITNTPHKDDFAVGITSHTLPDWVQKQVCDPKLVQAANDLANTLSDVTPDDNLTPIQTAVLRVLIVHSWRRIILKAPELPDAAFPQDWKGAQCRRLSQNLLAQLKRSDLNTLEESRA